MFNLGFFDAWLWWFWGLPRPSVSGCFCEDPSPKAASQTKNKPQKITLEGVGGDSDAAKATSARWSKRE